MASGFADNSPGHSIYFDFASDRLRAESEPVLREIAETLARHPDWTLSIDGHTDGVGGERANQQLSERRSAAVRAALVGRYQIDGARLRARGFGGSRPKRDARRPGAQSTRRAGSTVAPDRLWCRNPVQ